jgi:hypothetical protein
MWAENYAAVVKRGGWGHAQVFLSDYMKYGN